MRDGEESQTGLRGGAFDQYIIKDGQGGEITAPELLGQVPTIISTYETLKDPDEKLKILRLAKGQVTALWNSMKRADDTRPLLEEEVEKATDSYIAEKGGLENTGFEDRAQVRKMFKWDSSWDNSESMELNEGRRGDIAKKILRVHQVMEKAATRR